MVANSAKSIFAKLLVIGVGLPIVFQAFINMAVVVELFPTTGQPLPLISMGGYLYLDDLFGHRYCIECK